MDPDECLARIRKLYLLQYPDEEDVVELAQLVQDLDEFIVKSGGTYLPRAWKPRKPLPGVRPRHQSGRR